MTRYWMIGALLTAVPAQAQSGAPLPGWLAGAWCTEGPASHRTCEYWTPDSGGVMIGASITTRSGKAVEYEQERIEPVDGMPVFFASPGGAPAIAFRAVASDAASITFANDAHDYPQRIRYWREGEKLFAEISLKDGGKPMRWEYRRSGE